MAIHWLPFTIEKQLEAIQAILQIKFLLYDEKKELERIKNNLRYRISVNHSEKDFLQKMISKYGWMIKGK